MGDPELLHHRIVQAAAVSALLVACTPDATKHGTAAREDVEHRPRDKTPAQGRVEPVGVRTELDPDGEPTPPPAQECVRQTWCGSRAAAARIVVTKKPGSFGCPAAIAGPTLRDFVDQPEYVGLSVAVRAQIDERATSLARAAGDEDTCCYGYDPPGCSR
jgi:hypothetical protein